MSMSNTEKRVKDIRRNTRRKFSTEEKINNRVIDSRSYRAMETLRWRHS